MRQFVRIVLLPPPDAESLLTRAKALVTQGKFTRTIRELAIRNRVFYYSEHLDSWSMFDTFERFLRPRSALQEFTAEDGGLYAIPRDRLTLRAQPRDLEERLFRSLLQTAKACYQKTPGAIIFVHREVVGVSEDVAVEATI